MVLDGLVNVFDEALVEGFVDEGIALPAARVDNEDAMSILRSSIFLRNCSTSWRE